MEVCLDENEERQDVRERNGLDSDNSHRSTFRMSYTSRTSRAPAPVTGVALGIVGAGCHTSVTPPSTRLSMAGDREIYFVQT